MFPARDRDPAAGLLLGPFGVVGPEEVLRPRPGRPARRLPRGQPGQVASSAQCTSSTTTSTGPGPATSSRNGAPEHPGAFAAAAREIGDEGRLAHPGLGRHQRDPSGLLAGVQERIEQVERVGPLPQLRRAMVSEPVPSGAVDIMQVYTCIMGDDGGDGPGLQGAGRPHPAAPARPVCGSDNGQTLGELCEQPGHGAPVGDPAPRHPGAGQPRHRRPPRPGAAALPQPGADPRDRGALDLGLRQAPAASDQRHQEPGRGARHDHRNRTRPTTSTSPTSARAQSRCGRP